MKKITTKDLKSIILEVLEETMAQKQFSFMKPPKPPTQRQFAFMNRRKKGPRLSLAPEKLPSAANAEFPFKTDYKNQAFAFGKPQNIEEKAIEALVYYNGYSISWSGPEIQYWNKNFNEILKKHPNIEKDLVKRIIWEFGADRNANPLYSVYCIPLPFFQKHEKEILGNPHAARGIITLITDTLVWRQESKEPTEQAAERDLAPIELYVFKKYRSHFPEEKVSPANRYPGYSKKV
jgi:hypothetical protein